MKKTKTGEQSKKIIQTAGTSGMIASGIVFGALVCVGVPTIALYGAGIIPLLISPLLVPSLMSNYRLMKLPNALIPFEVGSYLAVSLIFSLACISFSVWKSNDLLSTIAHYNRSDSDSGIFYFFLFCLIIVCGLYLVHAICLIRGLFSLGDYKKWWYAENGYTTTSSPPPNERKSSPTDNYYDDKS